MRVLQAEDSKDFKQSIGSLDRVGGEGVRVRGDWGAERGTGSPSQPQKEPALATPGSQPSGHQSCETTHFCCLRPLIGGTSLRQLRNSHPFPFLQTLPKLPKITLDLV